MSKFLLSLVYMIILTIAMHLFDFETAVLSALAIIMVYCEK